MFAKLLRVPNKDRKAPSSNRCEPMLVFKLRILGHDVLCASNEDMPLVGDAI